MYILASVILLALITLILFILVRMYELRQQDAKQKKAFVAVPGMFSTVQTGGADITNLPTENATWKHIREKLLSDNPSEWKLAIIEGDIYLDRCLDDKGFHGDTTSDKLKQVTADKLPSMQMAREVHFIRNRIAHDGAAFVLTMPEARRLLSYYEVIFRDLGAI